MTFRDEKVVCETAELEFKKVRPKNALKCVKTAVAIASGRGGRLILSVENETRRIVGVGPETMFCEVVDWTAASLPRSKLGETPRFFKVVFERKRKSNATVTERRGSAQATRPGRISRQRQGGWLFPGCVSTEGSVGQADVPKNEVQCERILVGGRFVGDIQIDSNVCQWPFV